MYERSDVSECFLSSADVHRNDLAGYTYHKSEYFQRVKANDKSNKSLWPHRASTPITG